MTFRKKLSAIFAAAVLLIAAPLAASTPVQAATTWIAYAVNQQGNSWYTYGGSDEASTKQSARDHCENKWAYDCSQATSVPDTWYLVVADCVNSDGDEYYSTGSSQYNYSSALSKATSNANYNSAYYFEDGDCSIIRKDSDE